MNKIESGNLYLENIEKLYKNMKILLILIVVKPTSSVDDERNVNNLDIVKNGLEILGQN